MKPIPTVKDVLHLGDASVAEKVGGLLKAEAEPLAMLMKVLATTQVVPVQHLGVWRPSRS